jgi:hypothetical protein
MLKGKRLTYFKRNTVVRAVTAAFATTSDNADDKCDDDDKEQTRANGYVDKLRVGPKRVDL